MNRGADWLKEHFLLDLTPYDAVVEYRADDSYFSFTRAFLNNEISLTQLAYAMRLGKLGEQFVLKNPAAFAHNYLEILTMLKMKSLIITDLDYDKETTTFETAKNSTSTNATINHCYRLIYPEKGTIYSPSIKEIYEMQTEKGTLICNELIYIAYQDENSTARTLEEAMLNKLLSKSVFDKTKRSEWKSIRKDNNLTFTIPNNRKDETDSEFSIRQIVAALSNNKTDFMYSVVLSGNEEKMLPDYIKKGVLWLAK